MDESAYYNTIRLNSASNFSVLDLFACRLGDDFDEEPEDQFEDEHDEEEPMDDNQEIPLGK